MAHLSALLAGACLLLSCAPYACGQDGQDSTAEATTVSGEQEQTSASESIFPGRPINIGWPIFGGGFGPMGGGMRPWLPIHRPPIFGGGLFPGWPAAETTSSTDAAETAVASDSRGAGAARHAGSSRRGGSAKAAHSRAAKGKGRRARGRRG